MSDPRQTLAAYEEYRAAHPGLFANPPGAAWEIVFEPDLQRGVGAGLMYQDKYLVLLRDAVRFRDGSVGSYIRSIPAAARGGAAVLPFLGTSVVLLRHFRHATRAWHWEIPRGFTDGHEDPAQTARREIAEELGTPVTELLPLGTIHADTGRTSCGTDLFLARLAGLGRVETREGIDETRVVTSSELDAMLRAGHITDSFTLAAVLYARMRGLLA